MQQEALLIQNEQSLLLSLCNSKIQILNFAERVVTDVAHTSETVFSQCSSTIVLFTPGGTLL
jgi:hypothetical protein